MPAAKFAMLCSTGSSLLVRSVLLTSSAGMALQGRLFLLVASADGNEGGLHSGPGSAELKPRGPAATATLSEATCSRDSRCSKAPAELGREGRGRGRKRPGSSRRSEVPGSEVMEDRRRWPCGEIGLCRRRPATCEWWPCDCRRCGVATVATERCGVASADGAARATDDGTCCTSPRFTLVCATLVLLIGADVGLLC